jgi:hydrogenase nickel incorporation protein HypB
MGTVSVVRQVLDANDRIADGNRALFDDKGIFVINLMSSPGAGKTTWWKGRSVP